jgi:hypothetical protein
MNGRLQAETVRIVRHQGYLPGAGHQQGMADVFIKIFVATHKNNKIIRRLSKIKHYEMLQSNYRQCWKPNNV